MNPYQLLEDKITQATTLDESAKVLETLLTGGYAVWTDGSLYNVKQLVTRINGLKVSVYADEHPPPHFHVSGNGIDASFSIIDCSLTEGTINGRDRKLVEWWYARGRETLISTWNATRPTDCPVGPVKE